MIPNPRWFPTSLQERAAWYENFADQATASGTTYNLSAAEVTQIGLDKDMIVFLAETAVSLEAFVDGVRAFRKEVTEGPANGEVPEFPENLVLTPATAIKQGMFERLIDFAERIKASAPYDTSVGELYGIVGGPAPESLAPSEWQPVIQAMSQPGSIVEVTFTKGKTGGIYIETNVDNEGWKFADKATKSPVTLKIDAAAGGNPRNVSIRARYLDGNTPVGNWSSIVVVQTNP